MRKIAHLAKLGAHRLLRKVREDLHGALLDNRVVVLQLGHQGTFLLTSTTKTSPRDKSQQRHHKARLGRKRTQGNISWQKKTTLHYFTGAFLKLKYCKTKRTHTFVLHLILPAAAHCHTKKKKKKHETDKKREMIRQTAEKDKPR